MNSFWQQTEAFRNEVKQLLADFNIGQLYSKDAYNEDKQLITLSGEIVTITIFQKRLYENRMPHKTNCVGDVTIIMSDEIENECIYEYNYFLKLLSWTQPDYSFRMIVPSSLLSDEIMKQFTVKIITNKLPTDSPETEQIVYFNNIDGGEILLQLYPQIILEQKPL